MLLTDITAAEEAAIRQICPLICIKSLRGGNIAAKGNTHCVWQQCNLVTILPNLPGEIKYIIIRRSRNATTSDERTIRSTRFEREKILALLMLLKATCKPWTDIEINETQVNAWPVQGDLVELGNEVQTIIIEDEEQEAVNVDSDFTPSGNNHSHVQLDSDVDDYGPAPLQNDYIADETFEGTINMGDGNIAHGATAEMAVQTIENVVNRMRGNQVTVAQQTETEQGRSVVLQHTDVFTNDGFVDINKTQFVWARAFPSCYMPSYICKNGRMQWVITNDITGFNG